MYTRTNDIELPGKPETYLGWASPDANGHSVDEFTNLLISKSFWDKWSDRVDMLDTNEAKERAIAHAKYSALQRSFDIEDLPERTSASLLLDARKNGWHKYLPAEYGNLSDMLSGMYDRISEDNESSRRDLQFAVEEFFPALARVGVDVSKVLEIRDRWSKTRVAIPYIRQGLNQLSDKPEELSEFLKDMIDLIVDQNISVRKMREDLKVQGKKDHPTISTSVYQVGKDKFICINIVNTDGVNWLAKILQFKVLDSLKPLSKFAEFVKSII